MYDWEKALFDKYNHDDEDILIVRKTYYDWIFPNRTYDEEIEFLESEFDALMKEEKCTMDSSDTSDISIWYTPDEKISYEIIEWK